MAESAAALLVAVLYWHFLHFFHFTLYFVLWQISQLGYWWIASSIIILYVAHVLTDNRPTTGGGMWLRFCESWIVEYPQIWFPLQIVKHADLDWQRKYVFGIHPHGLMPWVILPIGRGRQWATQYPGILVRQLAASVLFYCPMVRETLIWFGAVDASHFNAKKALASGSSLSIIVGGSEEMMHAQPHTDVLVLKKRKGFVRLAIENGADLVPVYAYGASDLYNQMQMFQRQRLWLLKKTRFAFTFGWGTWFGYLLPEKRPVYMLVGKPIEVTQVDNPTDEQIDDVHQKYTESLIKLFEDFNAKSGENRQLIIT